MKKIKTLFPIIISLCVIGGFYYTKLNSLKLYPVLMNFVYFMLFFISLFQEKSFIQRIAQRIDGELVPEIIDYTRNLTYVWTCVTGFNLFMSLLTLFYSNKVWAIYNGCISYCLIGLTFIIEYPIRIWYKRKVGVKC